MENLWPNPEEFHNNSIEENNSIGILRDQARAIKSITNGIVNATFSKINYKPGPANALKAIGQFVNTLTGSYEEVLDEDLKDKEDINALFLVNKYKFELFNSNYRFRLFVFNYSELFPVSLVVDEGILDDINYTNGAPISNNTELKSHLKEILSSSKVRTVISKMLQSENSGTNNYA